MTLGTGLTCWLPEAWSPPHCLSALQLGIYVCTPLLSPLLMTPLFAKNKEAFRGKLWLHCHQFVLSLSWPD